MRMLKFLSVLFMLILTSCGDNANVSINPNQPNLKPSSPLVTPAKVSAIDDTTSVEQGSSSQIDVLNNDTIDDSSSTITIISQNNVSCSIVSNQVVVSTASSSVGAGLCVYQVCDSHNNCDQANIHINIFTPASPDLQVSKSVNSASATVGSNIIFTLVIKNNGPVNATSVALTDLLPSSLQFVSSSASIGSYNSTNGLWSVGSLANGATATLAITAKVLAAASGTSVTNTITNVTSANGDSNGSTDDNTATINVPVAAPDLVVTKSVAQTVVRAGESFARVGDTLIYTLTIHNNGPTDATGVALTDILPNGIQYVSSVASLGSYNSSSGFWSIGSLANSATAQLTITTKILPSALVMNDMQYYKNIVQNFVSSLFMSTAYGAAHIVTNTITNVTSNQGDSNTSVDDNTASIAVAVAINDIQVSKAVNLSSAIVGSNVIFTLTAKNNGPTDSGDVSLTDILPSTLQFISSTPSQGTYDSTSGVWLVGTLINGASATLSITAKILPAASGTSVTNTITAVSSSNGDSNTSADDNTATINVPIAVTVNAVDDSYNAGHNILSSLNVLSNDTFNLSSGTVSIVSGSNGTCTWNSTTNLINFLPTLGFSGSANCVYQICQGSTCDTATATINVAPFQTHVGPNQPIGCTNVSSYYPASALPTTYNAIGLGTVASPYIIYTAAQLAHLASISTNMNSTRKDFSIRSNIDFAPFYSAGGSQFSIPNNPNILIDQLVVWGNNCIINNFTKTSSNGSATGLFGKITGDAKFYNIRMRNTVIQNQQGVVGSLVGSVFQAVISDSSSSNFTINSSSSLEDAGGILGTAINGAQVWNTFACGEINVLAGNIGGLVGSMGSGFEIFDSYFKGKITAIKQRKVAGILGDENSGNVYSTPSILRSYSIGKIIGTGATNNASVSGITSAKNDTVTSKFVFSNMIIDNTLSDTPLNSAPINTNGAVNGGYFRSAICSIPMNCITNSLDAPVSAPISYFYNMSNAPMNNWGSQWTATTTFPTLAPGDPCDSYVVP